MKTIKLGDKVRDTVTGFQGVAVARTEWLQGCIRLNVQPPVDKEGKMPEACTFDEPQLEKIEKEIISHVHVEGGEKENGGPMPAATRSGTPARR